MLDGGLVFVLSSLMRSVVEDGTGQRAKQLGVPVAGKTGTAAESRDAWFAGFTEDYVTISKNSVVFEGTTVGEGVLILPDSMVPSGMNIPARTVMQGDPVITIRELSREDMMRQKERAEYYSELFDKIKKSFPNIQPYMLTQADFFRFMLEKR